MSDVTKCFFEIQLPAAQRDLFRLLWFENNGVERGKLVSYHFRVHPWGIKSIPYIACLAIKKLVEENPTCASDMTLQNILQNMYMDDLIFSVESLESAQTIANEAVSLFKSCGFKLVKWSAMYNCSAASGILAHCKKRVNSCRKHLQVDVSSK